MNKADEAIATVMSASLVTVSWIPTFEMIIRIAASIASLILAIYTLVMAIKAARKDGKITKDEAQDIATKTADVVKAGETVIDTVKNKTDNKDKENDENAKN